MLSVDELPAAQKSTSAGGLSEPWGADPWRILSPNHTHKTSLEVSTPGRYAAVVSCVASRSTGYIIWHQEWCAARTNLFFLLVSWWWYKVSRSCGGGWGGEASLRWRCWAAGGVLRCSEVFPGRDDSPLPENPWIQTFSRLQVTHGLHSILHRPKGLIVSRESEDEGIVGDMSIQCPAKPGSR